MHRSSMRCQRRSRGGDTRRRVLGALAAMPALGALLVQFAGDEADARKRRGDHARSR
jgi:hypothetical protein